MVIQIMNRGSDLDRTRRAESAKKVAFQKLKEAPLPRQASSPRGQLSIRLLVDEVIKYLLEIIEALLQEENAASYLSCLRATEKMHKELERKMANMVAEKCYEIRCEFLQKIEDIEKAQANRNSKLPIRNELKNQRKNITQNILAYHRANSFNSFGQHRSHELDNFPSENELPLVSCYSFFVFGNLFDNLQLCFVGLIFQRAQQFDLQGRICQYFGGLNRINDHECHDWMGLFCLSISYLII